MHRSWISLLLVFTIVPAALLAAPSTKGLHVVGNRIHNQDNSTIRLFGVNRSGFEFMCVQGYGFLDGPADQGSVNNMKSWNINIVRVPLNEDCWLGINGIKNQYAGQNYISAVKAYVDILTNSGLAVILDLHWTGDGSNLAKGQQPMPDADHSLDFWSGVARTFSSYSNVIFDLFNEPYPDNHNWNSQAGWQCWRDGGSSCSESFKVAGMQSLVTAVRSTGAKNLIMLGGLCWSNSLAQWLKYIPNDPVNNTVAAVHIYNFNFCSSTSCYDQYIAPVAAEVPVIIGEMGENDCNSGFIQTLTGWADQNGVSYLGWTWNTWDCATGPALITDYSGNPTNFGSGYRAHLKSLPPNN